MSYELTTAGFNECNTHLNRMADADQNSGITLPDALRDKLTALKAALMPNVNTYINLQGQDSEARRQARLFEKRGHDCLQQVKDGLKSQLDSDELAAVLQVYRLDSVLPSAREDILARLLVANEAVGQQADDNRKPSTVLQTELQACYDGLRENVELINGLAADIVEARVTLKQTLKEASTLRKRVRSFLLSVLPGRSKDPKLIDFGFKPRQDRRSNNVVVVVEEEEPVVVEP